MNDVNEYCSDATGTAYFITLIYKTRKNKRADSGLYVIYFQSYQTHFNFYNLKQSLAGIRTFRTYEPGLMQSSYKTIALTLYVRTVWLENVSTMSTSILNVSSFCYCYLCGAKHSAFADKLLSLLRRLLMADKCL